MLCDQSYYIPWLWQWHTKVLCHLNRYALGRVKLNVLQTYSDVILSYQQLLQRNRWFWRRTRNANRTTTRDKNDLYNRGTLKSCKLTPGKRNTIRIGQSTNQNDQRWASWDTYRHSSTTELFPNELRILVCSNSLKTMVMPYWGWVICALTSKR